jgi:hypothetical protein
MTTAKPVTGTSESKARRGWRFQGSFCLIAAEGNVTAKPHRFLILYLCCTCTRVHVLSTVLQCSVLSTVYSSTTFVHQQEVLSRSTVKYWSTLLATVSTVVQFGSAWSDSISRLGGKANSNNHHHYLSPKKWCQEQKKTIGSITAARP